MKRRSRSQWLADIINERGYIFGAELGAATGITTEHLLKRCPSLKKLVIADIWIPVGNHPHPWSRNDMEDGFRRKFGTNRRIRILKGLSWEMAKHIQDGYLDFVFIDACHEKECVKKDVTAWLPKLKVGGLLCGHDINLKGVRDAVEELVPGWIDSGVNNVWYKFKAV